MKRAALTAKGRKPDKENVKAPNVVMDERFRIAPFVIRLTEDNAGVNVPNRIQLFKTGTFKKLMPDGSTIQFSITRETLEEMIQNWRDKIRGVDIALDFAHKSDEEAAGWFKDLHLEEVGSECQLWAEIDWTPDGHAAVGGKKFRYVSPDFAFQWKDNETGKVYGATLFGAGLTNRPVIKNMAPTVELTEVKEMATKKTTVKPVSEKKITEMTKEELELRLAEEKDEDKIAFINLRLEEMSEDDDEDDDDGEGESKKKPAADKEMNMEELKAAYEKKCDELNEIKKSQAKMLAEAATKEKEAEFAILCTEGKAVPAQKEAYLAGDMKKFIELAQEVKFDTKGAHGAPAKKETSAQDEVLKLAEQAWKDKKVDKRSEAVGYVLSENPELNARYEKEMEGGDRPEAE